MNRFLLRRFGARIGRGTRINRTTEVTYPFQLEIGRDCQVWQNCYFETLAPVKLGDGVAVSRGVTFVTAGHEPFAEDFAQTARPIVVEDGVWIGCNATILGGVTIGKGAVIGAMALVNHDVPPETVAAGVPARVVRRKPAP